MKTKKDPNWGLFLYRHINQALLFELNTNI